jgi:hypothetical protein
VGKAGSLSIRPKWDVSRKMAEVQMNVVQAKKMPPYQPPSSEKKSHLVPEVMNKWNLEVCPNDEDFISQDSEPRSHVEPQRSVL